MATVTFDVPQSQRLADISGVISDLRDTARICQRWMSELERSFGGDWDGDALQVYCAAALVRYGRTFGSGVREGIPLEVIENLPEHHQRHHRYFKNARDKWIAHSANSFELNTVHLSISAEASGRREVAAVSVTNHGVSSLSYGQAQDLRDLALALIDHMTALEAEEKRRVLEYARTWDVKDLEALGATAPDPGGDPGKVRKRH